jgi:hypothetical protein
MGPGLKSTLTKTEVEFLCSLTEGDPVEVFNEHAVLLWRGTVETLAPELRVAWIRTEKGERKLLDFQERSIRPFPDPARTA